MSLTGRSICTEIPSELLILNVAYKELLGRRSVRQPLTLDS